MSTKENLQMAVLDGILTIALVLECTFCKREKRLIYYMVPIVYSNEYVCFRCRMDHFSKHKTKLKMREDDEL